MKFRLTKSSRCVVCGSGQVAMELYEEDRHVAYCQHHAPLSLRVGVELDQLHAQLQAGVRDAETLYGFVRATLREGDAKAASVLVTELLALSPEDVSVLEVAAEVAEATGHLEAAIAYQRKAVAFAPKQGMRHALLARFLALSGEHTAALSTYERGAAVDRYAFVCVQRAVVMRMARGDHDQALRLLQRFLRLDARLGSEAPAWSRKRARKDSIAVNPAAPQITARDFPGPLSFAEAERRLENRREFEVAANRYRAWHLLAHVHRHLGNDSQAAWALEQALPEIAGIPAVLLAEVGL